MNDDLKSIGRKIVNDAVDKAREERSKELPVLDTRMVFSREFKIYGDVENLIFLASDIAEAIEHSDVPKMMLSVSDDEKFIRKIYITSDQSEANEEVDNKLTGTLFPSGQFRDMWFLTENGVLELLTKSRKLKAKQLKLTIEEILKDIRDKKMAEIRDSQIAMVFENAEFGNLEILFIDGKPMFPGIEFAQMLGYANPYDAIIEHCDQKGIANREALTPGGRQKKKYIGEGNLYRLIIHSKLPSAERFERLVFDEILPSIRERGYYMTNAKVADVVSDPAPFIKELEEKNERLIADLEAERAEKKQLQIEVKKNEPKVNFANAMSVSLDLILLREFCKMLMSYGINIGQNRIFQWMRDNRYFIKKKGSDYNTPMQSAMDMGLFQIKESYVYRGGETKLVRTTYLTVKGQIYFLDKLLKEQQFEEETDLM
jgi:prophage antirepressor-like protein